MQTAAANSLNHAFKEWASIVEALACGEQILILRKGGIHEKGKKFNLLHESFFLFPTYEHQSAEDLSSRGQEFLKAVQEKRTAAEAADLPIEYYAEAKESFWIDNLEKLLDLSAFHVWSKNALEKRFHYGDEKGIYAIAVRVSRLSEKRTLKNLPTYGGCRSWVDLAEPIRLTELKPVLSQADFDRQLTLLKAQLKRP